MATSDEGASLPAPHASIPIQFYGKSGEYFRLWIVNLVLTLVTLGIYSAWAKVRRNRYLYGNTFVGGQAFEYTAQPTSILKGRLIAVVALVALVATQTMPVVYGVLGIAFTVAVPWVVRQALRFRYYHTRYCNIRFGFTGTVWGAAAVVYGWPLLGILTFGLLWPYAKFKKQQYLIRNLRFGDHAFQFNARSKEFYRIYVKSSFVSLVVLVLSGFLIWDVTRAVQAASHSRSEGIIEENSYRCSADDHDIRPEESYDYGLFVEEEKFVLSEDVPNGNGRRCYSDEEFGNGLNVVWSMKLVSQIILSVLIIIGLMSAVRGAFRAWVMNIIFCHTTIAEYRFSAAVSAWDLGWINFSNTLVNIVTLGFFMPWAQIRVMKTIVGGVALYGDTALDSFIQSAHERIAATGEELGDIFGLDIGF